MNSAEFGTEPIYDCLDSSGTVAALSWDDDHVYVSGFQGDDVADLAAVLDIARRLRACVVGDDGESYADHRIAG